MDVAIRKSSIKKASLFLKIPVPHNPPTKSEISDQMNFLFMLVAWASFN